MGTLQGPVICRPVVHAKQGNAQALPHKNLMRFRLSRSRFWGSGGICKQHVQIGVLPRQANKTKSRSIKCCFSSSSDGSGSMAENCSESDEDYVTSSVIEAVELRSGSDGFVQNSSGLQFVRRLRRWVRIDKTYPDPVCCIPGLHRFACHFYTNIEDTNRTSRGPRQPTQFACQPPSTSISQQPSSDLSRFACRTCTLYEDTCAHCSKAFRTPIHAPFTPSGSSRQDRPKSSILSL